MSNLIRPYVFLHVPRTSETWQVYLIYQLRLDSGLGGVLPVSYAPTAMQDPAVAEVDPLLPPSEPLSSFPLPGPFFRQVGQSNCRLRLETFEVLWSVRKHFLFLQHIPGPTRNRSSIPGPNVANLDNSRASLRSTRQSPLDSFQFFSMLWLRYVFAQGNWLPIIDLVPS